MSTHEKVNKNNAASHYLDPITQGVSTLCFFEQSDGGECEAIAYTARDTIKKQIEAIQAGDLSQIESSLYTQAIVLQQAFHKMVRVFAICHKFELTQQLLSTALKAQSQLRVTLETLARIKYPSKTVFVNQQNNALNQQINNSHLPEDENNSKSANELLSEIAHEKLDTGRPLTSIDVNSSLEAMETINGSQNL